MIFRYKSISIKLLIILLLSISIYFPIPALCHAEVESIIKQVEISGNRRIETSTILSKIRVKIGDIYSAGLVREDIIRLYETDYFEDIRVETETTEEGVTLIYHVKERPILKGVVYDGNDKITSERLKEKVTFITGVPFSQKQVKENVERLRE